MSKLIKKDLSIEVMRIISAFFVIFNHGGGFHLFQQYETGGLKFYTYLFISIFCKFAVPLFFMISGALLFGREEPIKVVYKKRVCKTLLILVGISVAYYVDGLIFGRCPLEGWRNIWLFGGELLSAGVKSHLWFLYSYIVLLMLLPFLRVLIKGMTQNVIIYLCILTIGFNCVVPVVQYLLFQGEYKIDTSFSIFTMRNIAAPIIGYWLYNRLDYSKVHNKHIVFLWMINVISICVACLMTHMTIIKIGTNSGYEVEQFFYSFATLNAATIFITIKKYYKSAKTAWVNKTVAAMGGATFGIFLFHYLLFHLNWFNYIAVILTQIGMPMTGWLIAAGVFFVINLIFVLILKKIPFINKYI